MIRKDDWQAVQDEWIAEDRASLGEPPTADEMLAYTTGKLGPEEEERVRARLLAYPELVHTLTAPFPEDGEEVPAAKVSQQWDSFRVRLPRKETAGAKVLQFYRATAALAAALAVVFGGMLWRETHRGPHVLDEGQELFADGQRGPGNRPVTLSAQGEMLVLNVPLYNAGAYEQYRLEIADDARTLWRSDVLPRRADDTFRIEVPRKYFDPRDRYRVTVFGVKGASEQRLDTYSLRVP